MSLWAQCIPEDLGTCSGEECHTPPSMPPHQATAPDESTQGMQAEAPCTPCTPKCTSWIELGAATLAAMSRRQLFAVTAAAPATERDGDAWFGAVFNQLADDGQIATPSRFKMRPIHQSRSQASKYHDAAIHMRHPRSLFLEGPTEGSGHLGAPVLQSGKACVQLSRLVGGGTHGSAMFCAQTMPPIPRREDT